MVLNILKSNGTIDRKLTVSNEIFKSDIVNQAMFDVVLSKRASLRQGTHSTKTRAEVSGGGKKPWRQKGTGRARAGSTRSPIWVGGGITFGPKPERNYSLKVNKKVNKIAMKSALTIKIAEKGIIVISGFKLKEPSTKEIIKKINALKLDKDKKKILVISDDLNVFKSIKNIQKINSTKITSLDVEKILHYDAIIMTEENIKHLEGVLK